MTGPHPEYTLIHETVLHAYLGLADSAVFANTILANNGLNDNGVGSDTITSWMGTDCKCTPTSSNTAMCTPNTAKW